MFRGKCKLMNGFHALDHALLSRDQNKANYGLFSYRKRGLNYIQATRESNQDTLRKLCMT